ncbi:MAG TPA: TonB-dependent receptor [Candidatus Angelobacter sp.]|nr:TonB-dependent receptor [Candidatus Angelobacter sp.]
MRSIRRARLALAFALTALSTFAATPSKNIHGTITDPLGAAVAGAQVQLLRDGKPVAVAITNVEGKYQFSPLAAGRYQVRAEAPTFAARQSDAIYLGHSNATVDLALKLPSISQQIVVSATGTQVPDTQVGAAVSVVPEDQFQFKLPALEPLRQVPGVQVLENGQRGINQSVFIRGGNSNANAVWLDGVPITEIGGTVDFGNVFTTGVDQVEVLRGPNSVLYGADALAGVINLTTARGKTFRPELSYAFDGGNFNSLHHDVSVGGIFRQLDYYSEFSRFDTNNAEPNAKYHNATYAGNFGWTPLASTELRLTVRRSNDNAGVPNAIDFFGIPDDSFQPTHNTYISATFQNQTTSHWHNLLRYGATRLDSQFVNPSPSGIFDPASGNFLGQLLTIRGANGFSTTGQAILDFPGSYPLQSFILTNTDFADVQSDYTFSPHLTALFGFRYANERSDGIGRTNRSYTGELHGSLGSRLFATIGAGIEDNAVFGVVPTPRVSIAYYLVRPRSSGLLSGTKIRANYGQGIKEADIFSDSFSLFGVLSQLPNGAQLISQFNVAPIRPERSRSYDVGVEQLAWKGRVRLNATFFYNRFTDQLEDVPQSGLISLGVPNALAVNAPFGAFVNSLATRAFGAETDLELHLGHGLTARAAYTYLDAVVLRSFSSDELFPSINPAFPTIPIGQFSPLVGNRPFNRAPNAGSFYLGYARKKLALTLSANLVSRRDSSTFLSDANFGPTMLLPNHDLAAAYQKFDFGGSYRFNPHLEFYAAMENLGSQHYDPVPGFPALPFNYHAGIKLTVGGESWK